MFERITKYRLSGTKECEIWVYIWKLRDSDFIASLSFLRILLSFLNECSLHLCCWKQIKPRSSNAEQALLGSQWTAWSSIEDNDPLPIYLSSPCSSSLKYTLWEMNSSYLSLTDFVPETRGTVITCFCCKSTGNLLLLMGQGGSVLGLFFLAVGESCSSCLKLIHSVPSSTAELICKVLSWK